MTGDQVREARKLLGWTTSELAAACGFTVEAIRTYERTGHMPASMFQRTNPEARLIVLRAALEAAGVEFIEQNGGGPGVRLSKAEL